VAFTGRGRELMRRAMERNGRIYYWKGEQLSWAAEGRAGGARPAGGGGFMAERPEEEDVGVGPAHQ
jgi:hypothetical protein